MIKILRYVYALARSKGAANVVRNATSKGTDLVKVTGRWSKARGAVKGSRLINTGSKFFSRGSKTIKSIGQWMHRNPIKTELIILLGTEAIMGYLDSDEGMTEEEAQKLRAAVQMTGIQSLHAAQTTGGRNYSRSGLDYKTSKMLNIIGEVYKDKRNVATGGISDDIHPQLEALSENERVYMIARLVSIIKTIAGTSNSAPVYDLYALQCLLSDIPNAISTEGMRALIDKDLIDDADVVAAAISVTGATHEMLMTMKQQTVDDYYDETTSILTDSASAYKKRSMYDSPLGAELLVQSLATNLNDLAPSGWFDNLTMGDDDDEALSAAHIREQQSANTRHLAAKLLYIAGNTSDFAARLD